MKRPVNIDVEETLWHQCRIQAVTQKITLEELVEQAIKAWLEKGGVKC